MKQDPSQRLDSRAAACAIHVPGPWQVDFAQDVRQQSDPPLQTSAGIEPCGRAIGRARESVEGTSWP